MKRILIIAGVLAVVVTGGWAGLWFVGRGEIEKRLDLEAALMEAQGWTVSWDDRRIGGFPDAYEVEVSQLSAVHGPSGALMQFPDLRVVAEAGNYDRIVASLPDAFTLALPIPEEQRAADPDLPRVITVEATSRGLVIAIEGTSALDRTVDIAADRLDVRVDQDDYANTLMAEVTGLDAGARQTGADTTVRLSAEQLDLVAEGAERRGITARLDVAGAGLSVTGQGTLERPERVAEMIFAGGPGEAKLAFQAGSLGVILALSNQEGTGTFEYATSAATGIMDVVAGVLDFRAEARDNRWTTVPVLGVPGPRGTVTARTLQARMTTPVAPAQTPAAAAARVFLANVEGDDVLWQSIDAAGALDRAPSELLIDVEGTLRVRERLDQANPEAAPPIEVANVIVNDVSLSSLGGKARAAGDIEFVQPVNLPVGQLDVSLSNAQAVLRALTAAGMVTPVMRDTANAILQVYARPVEGSLGDQWETEIVFDNGGVVINGQSVR